MSRSSRVPPPDGRTICDRPAPCTTARARDWCRAAYPRRPSCIRPELALGNVVLGDLPALGGLLQPLQQTLALLLPGDVEKELEHDHSIAGEMALEFADILEAFLLDVLADELGRDFLPLQQFGMHAHDQGLLVVRAVEDADPSSLRDAD